MYVPDKDFPLKFAMSWRIKEFQDHLSPFTPKLYVGILCNIWNEKLLKIYEVKMLMNLFEKKKIKLFIGPTH